MNIKDADIVRMTGEAGGFDATQKFLKRFAELVAEHEREECAEMVDHILILKAHSATYGDAIRARGKA